MDVAGDFAPISEQKTDRDRVKKYKQWFRQSHDASEEWRLKAIESYEFVSGNQWSVEDREKLKRQRRPMVTINKILSPINFMSGVQRQQRTKTILTPFEGGDARSTELMNGLLEYVSNCSRQRKIDSDVFTDMIVTGMGFWKIIIDFDDDPEGEVKWERIQPLAVFWDPNALDNGWEKSEYVIHASWWGLDAAMAQWPEHKDAIRRQFGEWLTGDTTTGSGTNLAGSGESAGDSLADRRLWWDAQTQRVRVIEVWYTTRTPVTVVEDPDTGETTAEPEGVDAAREMVKQDPAAKKRLKFHKRSVKNVHLAHCLNDIELDHGDSPYEKATFPIFPAVGYYFWRTPFGNVEPMKDPQREKNKRRSTMIEMVQRMPHSGYQNKMVGGAKTKDIEDFATGNGAVITYQDTPLIELRSPDLPQTLVWLDTRNDAEVRDVVNITAELLGNNTQRTVSGRAIEARQRSGAVTQEPMLDSFEEAKEPAVKFLITVVQQYFSLRKAARVLGTMAQKMPTSPTAQVMGQTPEVELIQLLSDSFDQSYDVELRAEPWEASQNRAKWQLIIELLETFGPDSVPPSVVTAKLRDAGLISEGEMQEILAFQNQKMQMAQMAQMQQAGGAPQAPGAPPGANPTLQ